MWPFSGGVYKLRKKYDRVREKADKNKDRMKKLTVLKTLDQIEPQMVILEEQRLTRVEKKRLTQYVESGIRKAEMLLSQEARPLQRLRPLPLNQQNKRY